MTCVHHWMLSEPKARLKSDGVCKKCGATREFNPLDGIESAFENDGIYLNPEKYKRLQRAKKSRAISKSSRVGFSI